MKARFAFPIFLALAGISASALAQPVGEYRGPKVIVIEQGVQPGYCCSSQCGVQGYRRGVFRGQSSIAADLYFDRVMPVLERIEFNCGGSSRAYAAANIRLAGDQVSLLRGAGFSGTLLDDTEDFASSAIANLGDEDALEQLERRYLLLLDDFAAAFVPEPPPGISEQTLHDMNRRQAEILALQAELDDPTVPATPAAGEGDVMTIPLRGNDGATGEATITRLSDGTIEVARVGTLVTDEGRTLREETFISFNSDGSIDESLQRLRDGEVEWTSQSEIADGEMEVMEQFYENGRKVRTTHGLRLVEAADGANPLGPTYRPRGNDGGEITSYFNEAGRLTQIDVWKREGGGNTETHERTVFDEGLPSAGVTHRRLLGSGYVDVEYWAREQFGTAYHTDYLDPSGVPEVSRSRIVTEQGTMTIERTFSDSGALSGVVISGEQSGVLEYRELDGDAYEILIYGESQDELTTIDALGNYLAN